MEDEIRQLHPELFKAIDREATAKLGAVRRVAIDEGLSPDVADMIERNIQQASQLCDDLESRYGITCMPCRTNTPQSGVLLHAIKGQGIEIAWGLKSNPDETFEGFMKFRGYETEDEEVVEFIQHRINPMLDQMATALGLELCG